MAGGSRKLVLSSSSNSGTNSRSHSSSPHSSSPRLSVQEEDALDGWLTRLERLPGALPSKDSLPQSPPTSPRPASARSSDSGTIAAATSAETSPRPRSTVWLPGLAITQEAPVEEPNLGTPTTQSSREASPRPSSSLELYTLHQHLLGSTGLRRHRSKSLSDKPDSETNSNSAPPLVAPSTNVHQRKVKVTPISWSSPSLSSPASPSSPSSPSSTFSRAALSFKRQQQEQHDKAGASASYTSRKLKRRSVPSYLPIVVSKQRYGKNSKADKEISYSDSDTSAAEGDTTVAEESEEDEGAQQALDRAKTPTSPSAAVEQVPTRKLRRMTSPLTSPPVPAFDTQSTRSSGSGSIASGRPGTSSGRYQPRSPFASQGSPEWRRRHFPRQASGSQLDSDGDENDLPQHLLRGVDEQGRRKERVTVTQALADLGRENMQSLERRRKDSKSSLTSVGSSTMGHGNSRDARRESIDSRASSNHSLRLFGRNSSKQPQLPHLVPSQVTASPSQSSPSTSSNYSAQQSGQPRKPRLEARDDRVRSVRPRFGSTKSTSSLPLAEDTASRLSIHSAGDDSDDDQEELYNSRRASIPNVSQLYASATSARANRASLAVPPAFNRSVSHDDTRHASQASGSTSSASDPPHTRDMAQAVLLWIPDEPAPSTSKGGHARNITKVLLGNVPRKKVTKRDSAQVLAHAGTSEGKGKERAKDRMPSVLPPGQWKQCEAVLKPTGQLSLFSEYVYLTSISVSSLQRTDIRPADPSLLLRQRVLGLHLHNTAFAPLPFGGPQTAVPSHFPISPSAPEFATFIASSSYTNLNNRPGTGKSAKNMQERSADLPQTLFLAFPSVATLQTWITALQNHARPEVYPSSARLGGVAPTAVEEEMSSSGGDDFGVTGSPRSPQSRAPRQRQGTGGWRAVDDSAQHPIRIYRSISLQIIELRGPREHISSSVASITNIAALARESGSNSVAAMPHPQNSMQEYRRTPSIASGSAASTEGSEDSSSIHAPTSSTTSPLSPSMASVSNLAAISNLAHPPQLKKGSSESKRDRDLEKEKEKKKEEVEQVYCEVCLDSEVIARTAIKKATNAAIWQETFSFPNLGPYTQPLAINVYTIQRSQQQLAGTVEILLKTATKNSKMQDWWPVRAAGPTSLGCTEAVGEMNLSIRIREIVSLPTDAYLDLAQVLANDTGADCLVSLIDAYPHLSLEDIASLLLRIDLGHDRVLPRLIALCEREVQACDGDAAILFRGNTLFTKSVELYMRIVGADFLEGAIGKIVRRVCDERIELEIDPSKMQGRERIAEHVEELERWTSAIWESIYNSRHQCPSDLRRLFRQIQQITERYFAQEQEAGRLTHLHEAERNKVKFTSISAFISLRFFGPAILNPRLFGLSSSHPADSRCQRTLTLIAKVLQGLANMSTFGAKEPWMVVMNPFLQANLSSFEDFIAHLCGKPESTRGEWTAKEYDLYSTPLAIRQQLSPDIVRESVPNLPFLIDLPKEYSVLASLVADCQLAESRMTRRRGSEVESVQDRPYNALVELCKQIEAKTRSRLRSLERMGELSGSGRAGDNHKMLVARPEGNTRANSTRHRGTTISAKSHFASNSPNNTPPRGTALYSSSPASNTSLSPEVGQESFSSLARPLDFSNRKRRSHTISVPATTPIASQPAATNSTPSPFSTPSRPLPLRAASNNTVLDSHDSDILEIHLPTGYSSPNEADSKSGSYRRTTISARPKMIPHLSSDLHTITSSVPLPEPKTPRAIPGIATPASQTITSSFSELQQQLGNKGTGGIEHEIAAQEAVKVKKGFFGRRK